MSYSDVDEFGPEPPWADAPVPSCGTCCDRGVLLDESAEGCMGSGENCPDCNPTTEQAAANAAEFQRRVDAGEIDLSEEPF